MLSRPFSAPIKQIKESGIVFAQSRPHGANKPLILDFRVGSRAPVIPRKASGGASARATNSRHGSVWCTASLSG
nr:MAG TPA: hypothetical protein [Caudoviricetes sp.]